MYIVNYLLRPYGASYVREVEIAGFGCPKYMKIGLNRVPVARLGLILGEDGATASRKLLRYLPDPKNKKISQQISKTPDIPPWWPIC